MRKLTFPILLAWILTGSGSLLLAQTVDQDRKHSVIRVITTVDGAGESNSEIETRFIDLSDPESSAMWVSGFHRKIGYLGVRLVDLTPELRAHFGVPEEAGVMVSLIAENSPALAAGLEVGDILTAIEGDAVTHSSDVSRKVSGYEEGRSVLLEVWRDRKARTLTAAIVQRERPAVDLGRLMRRSARPGETPVISEIFIGGNDGEKLFPSSGFGSEDVIEIDEDRLHEAFREFELRIESPDFVDKFRMLGRDREDLQQRILELEQRLKELEKQLEKLP